MKRIFLSIISVLLISFVSSTASARNTLTTKGTLKMSGTVAAPFNGAELFFKCDGGYNQIKKVTVMGSFTFSNVPTGVMCTFKIKLQDSDYRWREKYNSTYRFSKRIGYGAGKMGDFEVYHSGSGNWSIRAK